MKKINITILLSIILITSYAQNESKMNLVTFDMKPIHFGFILWLNSMSFSTKVKPNDTLLTAVPRPQSGFEIGITADLRLASHLNLRFIPGLSFGTRKIDFTLRQPDGSIEAVTKTAESTLLDFPLYFKYKTRGRKFFLLFLYLNFVRNHKKSNGLGVDFLSTSVICV